LTVLNTRGTDLLARAATQASIDMRLKRCGRILEAPLGHRPHQVKAPTWSIILVPRDHVRRTRLEAQPAMNARQQLVSLTRQCCC
jgi:hypothetical protein